MDNTCPLCGEPVVFKEGLNRWHCRPCRFSFCLSEGPERKPQISGFRGGMSGGFLRTPEMRDRFTGWLAEVEKRWEKGERPYLARNESEAWPMTQHQDSPPVAGKCPRCGDSCEQKEPPHYKGLMDHLDSCDVCDVTKQNGFCDAALALRTLENSIPNYYCEGCGTTFHIEPNGGIWASWTMGSR